MKLKILHLIIIGIILLPVVIGHGNVLYNVQIDWDSDFKNSVFTASNNFLNFNEEPGQIDYDHELLNVKFNRELEYSVYVHPLDFSIFGFRDDSLISSGVETLDQKARKDRALGIFNLIPDDMKQELIYGGETQLYTGSYQHTWYRYVNGIYVLNDHLQVEVDSVDGDIVAWKLSAFFYPKDQLPKNPAISSEVAQQIGKIQLKGKIIDEQPFLIYEKERLIWVVKIKSLYPLFVGINAENGRLAFSGGVRGDLPPNYKFGKEVEVVQNGFIKTIYEG